MVKGDLFDVFDNLKRLVKLRYLRIKFVTWQAENKGTAKMSSTSFK